MSINSLAFVTFSYIMGHIIWMIGRRASIYLGLIFTAITMIGFGSLYWVEHKILFISLALGLRYLAGVGQSFVLVSCYSMAAIRYKDTLQQKMGLLEAAFGSAFLIGPALGGLIYHFTNFYTPFYASA